MSSMDETPGLYKSAGSRYMTRPQFSMAPAAKSGIAIWSKRAANTFRRFHLILPVCICGARAHAFT